MNRVAACVVGLVLAVGVGAMPAHAQDKYTMSMTGGT